MLNIDLHLIEVPFSSPEKSIFAPWLDVISPTKLLKQLALLMLYLPCHVFVNIVFAFPLYMEVKAYKCWFCELGEINQRDLLISLIGRV